MIGYDNTTHHLLSFKLFPDSLIELRKELLNHPDILEELTKPQWNTFELCCGRIAQMLNIAMDGLYEPEGLFAMLTEALKNRHIVAELNPHLAAPGHGLKQVELQEREMEIELAEIGEDFGWAGSEQAGTGPYTICLKCISTFECCDSRSCKLGKPAVQLERTVEMLKRSLQ